jgi:hypothetical protein
MAFADIVTGAVIRYPYLWLREARRGETEGRKDRPVAVAVRMRQKSGRDVILVFPITSKMPSDGSISSEIPDLEKRRAGLDPEMRLWIVLDEYNGDAVGKSYFLRDEKPIGFFSQSYFLPLIRQFIKRKYEIRGVDNTR